MKIEHVLLIGLGIGGFAWLYKQYETSVNKAEQAYLASVKSSTTKK